MAREMNKLTAKKVASLKEHGRHSDGGGLYLAITHDGSKRWTFLYSHRGRRREMGLGAAARVSLKTARELAQNARDQLAKGSDPQAARKAARKPAAGSTFGEVADRYVDDQSGRWRNEKSEAAWRLTLGKYCFSIRRLPVADITVDDIVEVLKPVWTKKPETAARLRGRIEKILDVAKAGGLRVGENPAVWRGLLEHKLPKRQRLTRGHHAALPYDGLSTFMASLRARDGVAARALEFTILTAARTGETIGARWSEIDTRDATKPVWTVPAGRMKGGEEHQVPLSPRCVALLRAMEEVRVSDFVFPGPRRNKPLSNMAMSKVLERMDVDVTTHGFRSTFRDWCGEETSFPHEVCEMALAHVIANKAEAAYRRGKMVERRRGLMNAWALYASTPTDESRKVVPFAGKQVAG